jgi:hypothetical protein
MKFVRLNQSQTALKMKSETATAKLALLVAQT